MTQLCRQTIFPVLTALLLFAGNTAFGQAGQLFAVDENGNSNFGLLGSLAPDPGPGGLPQVLTYHLPFAGVPGDVLMEDPVGGPVFDIIRFNGNGTLLFYSDNTDGFDALADTSGPPSALYPNQVRIGEVGPEGNNGAFYQPLPNQPGYDPNFLPTYRFVSDGTIPEPGAQLLLLVGVGAIGLLNGVRKRQLRTR